MPNLIITADDCGLSPAINQTTLDLHQRGYITAASIMTNFPAHQHALDNFRHCPDLDLGVHLNLTDGFPLSQRGPHHSHLLKDDRSFRSNFSLYLRSHFFSADTLAWIRHELEMQLDRVTAAGLRLGHITSHHHFHSIPTLRRLVHDLAADYRVDWVRGHDFRATLSSHNPILRPQRQLPQYDFDMPDFVTALQANMSRPVKDFSARLARLTGTIEVVVHPAPARDHDFPPTMDYGPAARHAETQYLIKLVDHLRTLGLAPTLD